MVAARCRLKYIAGDFEYIKRFSAWISLQFTMKITQVDTGMYFPSFICTVYRKSIDLIQLACSPPPFVSTLLSVVKCQLCLFERVRLDLYVHFITVFIIAYLDCDSVSYLYNFIIQDRKSVVVDTLRHSLECQRQASHNTIDDLKSLSKRQITREITNHSKPRTYSICSLKLRLCFVYTPVYRF